MIKNDYATIPSITHQLNTNPLDHITPSNYNKNVHFPSSIVRGDLAAGPGQTNPIRTDCTPGPAQDAMKINNADIRLITDKIIYLEEIGEGITYDIDKFVSELKRFIDPTGRRIICRDDMGHCDELQLDQDGQFYRFIPLPDDDPVIYRINSYFRGL